jgi:hypothetical protein
VDTIAWSQSPKDTFSMGANVVYTYVDYYKSRYDIVIEDIDQVIKQKTKK